MTPSCKWPIAADVLAAPRFLAVYLNILIGSLRCHYDDGSGNENVIGYH